MVLVDVMIPTSLRIPEAHDINGTRSGAHVVANVTGAIIMSGSRLCYSDGTNWRMVSGAAV